MFYRHEFIFESCTLSLGHIFASRCSVLAAPVKLVLNCDHVTWHQLSHSVSHLSRCLIRANLCDRVNSTASKFHLCAENKNKNKTSSQTWQLTEICVGSLKNLEKKNTATTKQTMGRVEKDFVGWLVCRKKHLRLISVHQGSTWKRALEDEECLFFDTRSSSLTSLVLPRGNAAFSCSISLWVRVSQTVYRPNTTASPAGNMKGCRATKKGKDHNCFFSLKMSFVLRAA